MAFRSMNEKIAEPRGIGWRRLIRRVESCGRFKLAERIAIISELGEGIAEIVVRDG